MTPQAAVASHASPMLRPGAELLSASEDKLHISFANHTVTFTNMMVIRAVRALVTEMECGGGSGQVTDRAARRTGLDRDLVGYVLRMLDASHCLYWSDCQTARVNGDTALALHFSSVGDDPIAAMTTLRESRPLVLATEARANCLDVSLKACCISVDIAMISEGSSIDAIAEVIQDRRSTEGQLIVAWGFPYRAPAARMINSVAMSGMPVLFGSCDGLIGRIGPLVIPRHTPCLECLNSRLLSHSGAEERSAYDAYRLRHADSVARQNPTHPLFLNAVSALFVLELQEILLNRPPATLGGIIDVVYNEASLQRRTLLKAPRCEACASAKPSRVAWNTRFSSPNVKGGGLES